MMAGGKLFEKRYLFSVRSAHTECRKIQRAGNATGLWPYPPCGGAACPYLAANILGQHATTPPIRSTTVFVWRTFGGDTNNAPCIDACEPGRRNPEDEHNARPSSRRSGIRMGTVGAGCPAEWRIGPVAGPWHCLPSVEREPPAFRAGTVAKNTRCSPSLLSDSQE
jgi:hypothetical protein